MGGSVQVGYLIGLNLRTGKDLGTAVNDLLEKSIHFSIIFPDHLPMFK